VVRRRQTGSRRRGLERRGLRSTRTRGTSVAARGAPPVGSDCGDGSASGRSSESRAAASPVGRRGLDRCGREADGRVEGEVGREEEEEGGRGGGGEEAGLRRGAAEVSGAGGVGLDKYRLPLKTTTRVRARRPIEGWAPASKDARTARETASSAALWRRASARYSAAAFSYGSLCQRVGYTPIILHKVLSRRERDRAG